jgi:hypothetical protein
MAQQLSLVEESTLEQCERVIAEGIHTFIEVGLALLTVRKDKLYRQKYRSFEQYCRNRWNMSKTHANRMITASTVATQMTPMGVTLPNERQARALSQDDGDDQPEAWNEVIQTAPNGKVTAKHIKEVVKRRKSRQATPVVIEPEIVEDAPDWENWENTFYGALDNLMLVFEGVLTEGGFEKLMSPWPMDSKRRWLGQMVTFREKWDAIIDQLERFCADESKSFT